MQWPFDGVFSALVAAYPIGKFDSPIALHRPADVEQLTDVEFDTKLVPHRKCPGVSIDEVTVSEHRSDVADEYRNAFSKPTRLAIPTLITMRPLESAMSGFGSTAGIRVIEDVVVK